MTPPVVAATVVGTEPPGSTATKEKHMPKYLIRRSVNGIGAMSPEELHELSFASNKVLAGLPQDVQWVQSYVTGDHLFCIYNAESPDAVREHARVGGFPCDEVRQVTAVIDPITGEG